MRQKFYDDAAMEILKSLPKYTLKPESKENILIGLKQERYSKKTMPTRVVPKYRTLLPGLFAGIVGFCCITLGIVHFVPRWGVVAQAAFPGILGVPPVMFKYDPGLQLINGSNRVKSVRESDTHSGYKIEMLGAYSDENRTVVFIRTLKTDIDGTTRAVNMRPQDVWLTDQFGIRHDLTSANIAPNDPSFEYLQFEPLSGWEQKLGVRFTLHVGQLIDGKTLGQSLNVAGPWSLNWVETSFQPSYTLMPNTITSDNGTNLTLTQVTNSPTELQLVFNVSSPIVFPKSSSAVQAKEGQRNLSASVTVVDPNGKMVQILGMNESSTINPQGHMTEGVIKAMFAPITKPGTYKIEITGYLFGEIDGYWSTQFKYS
jgi:hypothetical protein